MLRLPSSRKSSIIAGSYVFVTNISCLYPTYVRAESPLASKRWIDSFAPLITSRTGLSE